MSCSVAKLARSGGRAHPPPPPCRPAGGCDREAAAPIVGGLQPHRGSSCACFSPFTLATPRVCAAGTAGAAAHPPRLSIPRRGAGKAGAPPELHPRPPARRRGYAIISCRDAAADNVPAATAAGHAIDRDGRPRQGVGGDGGRPASLSVGRSGRRAHHHPDPPVTRPCMRVVRCRGRARQSPPAPRPSWTCSTFWTA